MSSTSAKFSSLFSRRSPGGVYTIAGIEDVAGDVFFVDSAATGAANDALSGTTPDKPFATLAYAFSSDRVDSGDVVYVMPGHAETVDAAGDITMDIAGVRVVGLGRGTVRPTFTFATDTAATWLISAANVSVENVLITTTGTIDVVNAITISAADVSLIDVEVRESASNSQFVDPVIITTGAARCKLIRYKCRSHASGDAIQSGVLIDAAVDGVEIDDAWIDGLFATGNIESTAAATNTTIRNPILRQRHATQDAAINLHASNTGFVVGARIRIATNDTASFAGAYVGAAAQFYDMLVVNAAGTAGSSPGTFPIPDVADVPGSVYFVSSTAAGAANSAANGTTKELPFATLAYAFSAARVASGDTVYVMPSHAETVSAAGGITMNIAGVTVIGLGKGTSRPTFTFATDTAATWLITAANVTVKNVLLTVTGTIDVVNGITVTGTDSLLEDVEVRDSAATSQIATPIILGATSTRARLNRLVIRSHVTGDAAADGVLISSAVDGVEINDAWIDGLFATGCIRSSAAATNTVIQRPILRQRHASQAAAINLHASNTGAVISPRARITLSTGGLAAVYVGAAMQFYDSIAANAAGQGVAVTPLGSGGVVSKASGAITGDPTTSIFTVAGGEVIIRDLWLVVTTSITTDSGTLAMQINPTTGDTFVIVTATDLGTTDTVAGSVVGLDRGTTAASKFLRGGRTDLNAVATTGTVELVGAASANGAVTVYCRWEPVVAGATLVAS